MEAFEHVCRVALEAEGYAVSTNVKFYVVVPTKKKDRSESQRHGFEVDLVGANARSLILASVKSFFGSVGVQSASLSSTASDDEKKRYRIFHDAHVQATIVDEACAKYGYSQQEVELRLYVGKFKAGDESAVRNAVQSLVRPPLRSKVVGPDEILSGIEATLTKDTYVDDPVVATLRLQRLVRR
ncbi:hypothetical protein WME91_17115 [Sorangium sp. So ce269]